MCSRARRKRKRKRLKENERKSSDEEKMVSTFNALITIWQTRESSASAAKDVAETKVAGGGRQWFFFLTCALNGCRCFTSVAIVCVLIHAMRYIFSFFRNRKKKLRFSLAKNKCDSDALQWSWIQVKRYYCYCRWNGTIVYRRFSFSLSLFISLCKNAARVVPAFFDGRCSYLSLARVHRTLENNAI